MGKGLYRLCLIKQLYFYKVQTYYKDRSRCTKQNKQEQLSKALTRLVISGLSLLQDSPIPSVSATLFNIILLSHPHNIHTPDKGVNQPGVKGLLHQKTSMLLNWEWMLSV